MNAQISPPDSGLTADKSRLCKQYRYVYKQHPRVAVPLNSSIYNSFADGGSAVPVSLEWNELRSERPIRSEAIALSNSHNITSREELSLHGMRWGLKTDVEDSVASSRDLSLSGDILHNQVIFY